MLCAAYSLRVHHALLYYPPSFHVSTNQLASGYHRLVRTAATVQRYSTISYNIQHYSALFSTIQPYSRIDDWWDGGNSSAMISLVATRLARWRHEQCGLPGSNNDAKWRVGRAAGRGGRVMAAVTGSLETLDSTHLLSVSFLPPFSHVYFHPVSWLLLASPLRLCPQLAASPLGYYFSVLKRLTMQVAASIGWITTSVAGSPQNQMRTIPFPDIIAITLLEFHNWNPIWMPSLHLPNLSLFFYKSPEYLFERKTKMPWIFIERCQTFNLPWKKEKKKKESKEIYLNEREREGKIIDYFHGWRRAFA